MHAPVYACILYELNVFADDDNRIVLKPLADVSDCQRDYINACYVDVSLVCTAYSKHLLMRVLVSL